MHAWEQKSQLSIDGQTKTRTDCCELLLKDQNLSVDFEEILDILKLSNRRTRLIVTSNICTIIEINFVKVRRGGGGGGGIPQHYRLYCSICLELVVIY